MFESDSDLEVQIIERRLIKPNPAVYICNLMLTSERILITSVHVSVFFIVH